MSMGFIDSLGKILGGSSRPASAPVEGAARQAVLGAILGALVPFLTSAGMDPAQVDLVARGLEMALGALLLGGSALLGKILRDWAVSRGGWIGVVARFIPLG